ncbi:response regulator [Roseibium sp.]|uniref:response regulator n=1 Tax=Roseibium sp. TaxID=1936156 RepID=UPI003D0C5F7E
MAERDDDGVKIALLAHDLRTPLSAMRLTAELIGNGPLDAAQKEQLSILVRSIDALVQMTGELVSAAGPGAGPGGEACRITDCIADVSGLFEIAATAKGLSLDLAVENAVDRFVTRHGGTLRRVAATLLDNAVKYTPSGGIKVRVSPGRPPEQAEVTGQDWVALTVEDSGPGIDPEERARLFRPFVRGRQGRETGPGTGLGLWGTSQLVQEMGGELHLTEGEAGGSRFEVLIPVTPDGSVPARTAASAPAQATGGPAGPLPKHVLIVDDNETNCRLLEALLESFGISSEVARSGEQAVGIVQKQRFDAVLLDLHMPGMSGLETAQELRALKPETELPLIAVTAALDSVADEQLRDAGFQDFLAKPLSPAALFEVMKKAGQALAANSRQAG